MWYVDSDAHQNIATETFLINSVISYLLLQRSYSLLQYLDLYFIKATQQSMLVFDSVLHNSTNFKLYEHCTGIIHCLIR